MPAASTTIGFSGADFRRTLGAFATGVTVITTRGEEGRDHGMTATAFSSVSLDPPLVLVCVMSSAEGSQLIPRNGCFAVNILASHQEALSNYFASRHRPRGPEAFSEVDHHEVVTGSPVLEEVVGFLDCRLAASYEAGDHMVFIGEVLALAADPDREPLVFHGSRYRALQAD